MKHLFMFAVGITVILLATFGMYGIDLWVGAVVLLLVEAGLYRLWKSRHTSP